MYLVYLALLLSVIYPLYHFLHLQLSSALPLPPGPPSHPFSRIRLPKIYAYRYFEPYIHRYGPVFLLRSGFGIPTVVVGRVEAAIEILEKHGAATSDRPRNISAGEILSGGMRVLLTPQGDRCRKMRKAMHVHLQPSRSDEVIGPLQMKFAKQHILNIIRDPEHHQGHARLYAASLVMALTYGIYDVGSYEDPRVLAVNRCLRLSSETLIPGRWKVDTYPWLRFVPGYLRQLRLGHETELQLFRSQVDKVKSGIEDSQAPQPSLSDTFVSYLINNQPEHGLSDNEMSYLAGSIFGAGSDTTASAISIVVLASALHKEHQDTLAAEIKSAFHGAPPTLDDIESGALPFLHAFVWETFRWRPVAPGGFAHNTTQDVFWNGYVIPKGTAVIGNTWSISRDPDFFPDPETFNPMRWVDIIDGQYILKENLKAKAWRPFGWGRRICPGSRMATRSTLVNAALLHWAFKIEPATGDSGDGSHGSKIDSLAFTIGSTAIPLPFKVRFCSRLEMDGAQDRFAWVKKALSEYGNVVNAEE